MFDFANATDDELLLKLQSCNRQLVHTLKARYTEDPETLERITNTYAEVKREKTLARRCGRFITKSTAGKLWLSITRRSDPSYQDTHPSYKGCVMSENFKDFQFFADWCYKQTGFENIDENGLSWEIDKDILSPDLKIYSENNCVFVPREVNCFVKSGGQRTSELPLGVYFDKVNRNFVAQYSGSSNTYLGRFNSAEAAFECYKTHKEEKAKYLAEKWKGKIDMRVYFVLSNYKVAAS